MQLLTALCNLLQSLRFHREDLCLTVSQEGEKATKPQEVMIEEEDDEADEADSQQLMPGELLHT